MGLVRNRQGVGVMFEFDVLLMLAVGVLIGTIWEFFKPRIERRRIKRTIDGLTVHYSHDGLLPICGPMPDGEACRVNRNPLKVTCNGCQSHESFKRALRTTTLQEVAKMEGFPIGGDT